MKTKTDEFFHEWGLYVVVGIIVLIIGFNTFNLFSVQNLVQEKIKAAKEASKPATIQLTMITEENCPDCFDIATIYDGIKKLNVNVTKENRVASSAASDLIAKYQIKKTPTVIVTGELDKLTLQGFEKIEDAAIFTALKPIYFDPATGKKVGEVTLTIIEDKNCKECFDTKQVAISMKQLGVKITKERKLQKSNGEAAKLIAQYKIDKIPAIIFSKDFSAYTEFASEWKQLGTIEKDGSYVFRQVVPPYVELSTGKIVGLVTLTYITAADCKECYDVKMHKTILQNFGVKITEEKTVDASQSDLVKKYKISQVPTIILSADAKYYPALQQVWQQVGSVESDGTFVFRNVDAIGATYKNLDKNEVIKPQQNAEE
ncbi:MAG: hypothetical protein QW331_02985 [Candidatus Woesearchaeota archaeon]